MKRIVYILMLSVLAMNLPAQKESSDVRTGNKFYKTSKFTEAEIAYRKALVKNKSSFEANYNLGNALFRQKKYPEALGQYNNALALNSKEKTKLAAAFHNAGNSLLVSDKIEESIKAYKSALKNNPSDNETRYNLAYAQSLLKNQKKDKNKDKKDQNKDQKKDQNQQPQPQPQQPKEQPQQAQSNQPKMSKENAQQILDALQQDEKNAQDKAKKVPVRATKKAEKDW